MKASRLDTSLPYRFLGRFGAVWRDARGMVLMTTRAADCTASREEIFTPGEARQLGQMLIAQADAADMDMAAEQAAREQAA